jgi:hypothetical protein
VGACKQHFSGSMGVNFLTFLEIQKAVQVDRCTVYDSE